MRPNPKIAPCYGLQGLKVLWRNLLPIRPGALGQECLGELADAVETMKTLQLTAELPVTKYQTLCQEIVETSEGFSGGALSDLLCFGGKDAPIEKGL